ncbi:hypothetical protein LVJ94_39965 [Pendulispora rubella]|uniref:Polysaccharide chain length determinant N-terminal domain-containing protein n=1 Tax=Pendulispora rubella TaxID=2741070 RepID=A0ABZ2L353_9BACT
MKQAFRITASQYRDSVSGQFVALAPPRELTPRERMERARVVARRAATYWKSAAALFVLGAIISIAIAANLTRIYRSECVVLVRPAISTGEREESPSERAMKLAPKLKDTLLTRTRLEPVIREFNLYPKTVESKGMIDAVEEMRLHVGFRGRDSETFVISFEDEDSERTRAVTQRLAESTMEEFRKGNLSTSKQQADFLGVEQKRAEEALENANRQLATFLAAHPEFAAETRQGGMGGQPGAGFGAAVQQPPLMPGIVAAQHSTDPQLASLYRQKARLENEMRARANPGAAPTVNDSVANLAKARDEAARRAAQAQADLADKVTRFTDQHPDVIAARSQVDAAARTLQAAEANLEAAKKGDNKGQADIAQVAPDLQKRVEDVQRQIAQRQAEVAKHGPGSSSASAADTAKTAPVAEPTNPLVLLETEWQRLLRATSDAKSSHDDLARRMDRASLRASAAEATGDAQMEIIDPAYRPTRPARGGRTNAALIGLSLTMFLAVGFAFARVATNDTLIDAYDVELLRMLPVLGTIPKLPPSPSSSVEPPAPRNSVRSETAPPPRPSGSGPSQPPNGGGNTC